MVFRIFITANVASGVQVTSPIHTSRSRAPSLSSLYESYNYACEGPPTIELVLGNSYVILERVDPSLV